MAPDVRDACGARGRGHGALGHRPTGRGCAPADHGRGDVRRPGGGVPQLQAVHPAPDHPQRDVGRAARVTGRARDPDRPSRHRAHGPAVRDPMAPPGAPAATGHLDEPAAFPLLVGDGGARGRDRGAGGGGLGSAHGTPVRTHGDLSHLHRAAARRGRGRSLSGRRRQRLRRRGRARCQPPPGGRPAGAGGDAGRLLPARATSAGSACGRGSTSTAVRCAGHRRTS